MPIYNDVQEPVTGPYAGSYVIEITRLPEKDFVEDRLFARTGDLRYIFHRGKKGHVDIKLMIDLDSECDPAAILNKMIEAMRSVGLQGPSL